MKKLVINLLLLISTAAFGSIYTPVFKNITNENGLANSTVRCITKDEDGFMWFGTYDGLCRYDGISIKIFRRIANSNNELNHNHISALFCNSKNQLFVGTRKGLNRYVKNFDTFRPVSYRESGTNMLKTSSVEITAIVEQSGNMLVATLGQGLLALDQHDSRFHQIKLPGNARQLFIHSMAFSSNDCVYLGIDDQGIYQYNLKTKITKLITGKLKQTLCFFYSDRKLFIGTNNGLFSYNEVSGTVSAYQINNELKSPVQFIHKDSRNILWVGTENKGIVLINTGNNSTQHIPAGYNSSALSSEGVYCMYIDKSGYIWIGTMRGGVEVWNPIQKEFQSRKNLLSKTPASNFINCFLEIKPQLFWLGTDGGNIQQYNLSKDRFEQNSQLDRINQIAGNTVICSVKDNAGNAWFGTYGNGLIKYNLKTNQFKRYTKSNSRLTSNDIWSLYIDKSGSLWIGAISGGGLFRYNPVNDSFDFRNIRLDNILVVTETKNDQLIIGNYSGVTVYDLKHRKLLIFHTNTPVRSICEDKQQAIWIGTEGNGLMNLNLKTHKLTPASHKLDYLKKSTIMSIIEDEHQNLWISTSNGLFRFHYPTEVLTTFNKKDGLQDEQFNYSSSLKSEKGMMLFGGINGFTFFDPDKITTAQPAYPLHITDLSIHNSSIFTNKNKYGYIINMLSKKEIRVKHKDAYIRFDFIAISYDNPDKIQYAYMLDHMDKNWIIAGNSRSANYSGLPPGHYTFKVSYATQPGQWNKKVLEVKLHVLPPYYLTWWAFLIYLICTSAIAYSIIHFQKRQNKLKQDLLLADLKEEQVRQVQQMREQFFINISHELRTPLTLIIPPIKDSLTSVPFAPIGKAELQTVYNNANRLLLLINKLLLFRKNEICKNQLRLTKTDFVDFAGKIYKNFSQIAVKRNISYVFKAPNGPVPFWFDLDKMEIILYNLLSNAFKFTPEYGKIELEIFVEDNAQLCLSVKDTGCGISQADLDHIFNRFYSSNKSSGIGIGLSLVKNYIELLHGELTIETALEKGSTFSIRFDMNAHYEEQEMVKETVPEYLPSKDMVELVKIDTLLYLDQHTKEKEEALSLNKPKILVVEDNPEILAYIKRILLETGQYDVLEASNGKVAWKMAKKTLPDMILSDIYMPEMDGLDLCKAIKEEEETNHIYFILITADLFDATENKALKYGADEYITKPFDKDKLLNKIKTIFNYQQKIRKYFNNKIILGKKETVPTTVNTDFIDKCIKQVKDNYTSEEFSPLILAQKMNMSQSALYKKIKLCTGKSINEFIRTIKLSIASELILQSSLSISEIATEVGINDVKYFRDCFKKQFGVTPSQYKSTGHLTDNAPLTQETDDID